MGASSLLTSIQQRRPVVGCAHMIRDEAVTEALRGVATDFLLVDMQHVAFGLESLQSTLIALHPSELAVLVRIPSNDYVTIGQMFDLGVTGVIVPMVNTRQDAMAAVAAAKYPPVGIRSWGPRRVSTFHGDPASYALTANDNTIVIVQIETQEAVDNLDDIISVPGLNGVMVGPADLAISMGYIHDRENQTVQSTLQFVLDRCLENEMPFGFFASSLESALYWIERGATILNCSSDSTFVVEGFNRIAGAVADLRAAGR